MALRPIRMGGCGYWGSRGTSLAKAGEVETRSVEGEGLSGTGAIRKLATRLNPPFLAGSPN